MFFTLGKLLLRQLMHRLRNLHVSLNFLNKKTSIMSFFKSLRPSYLNVDELFCKFSFFHFSDQ